MLTQSLDFPNTRLDRFAHTAVHLAHLTKRFKHGKINLAVLNYIINIGKLD